MRDMGGLLKLRPAVTPGVYDALTARLVCEAGFDGVFVSGYALAAGLGLPDVGSLTMTEALRVCEQIVEVSSKPVWCDIDDGYGDIAVGIRSMQRFEQAGLVGVLVEDQRGHNHVGHPLLSIEEMCRKIEVLAAARKTSTFCLMIRSDSPKHEPIDLTIERCNAYQSAGADVLLPLDISTVDDMRKLTANVEVPLVGVISPPHPPVLSVAELHEIGFDLVQMSVPLQFAMIQRAREVLQEFKSTGSILGFIDELASFASVNELLQRAAVEEAQARVAEARRG